MNLLEKAGILAGFPWTPPGTLTGGVPWTINLGSSMMLLRKLMNLPG
jgi:hypothetical protein